MKITAWRNLSLAGYIPPYDDVDEKTFSLRVFLKLFRKMRNLGSIPHSKTCLSEKYQYFAFIGFRFLLGFKILEGF